MFRSLLGCLVGCVVGRFFAADVKGKPDPRGPHVQWTFRYFTPGFGPLALARGWLLLGILLGLLFRRAAATMVALAGGHPADGAPHSWEALLHELSARTRDPHRHEVLHYLLQGGEAAVRELSQATNRTPAALIAHLLNDSTSVADAAAPRPTNAPTRRRSGRQ